MKIALSDHFTYKRLIRFTLPSVIMMVFTSLYGIVDGIFISNFVGKTQFAAVSLILPVCIILGAFGFMIGSGGSALVSKLLGEGEKEAANSVFSMLVYVSLGFGIFICSLGIIFLRPISIALGAQGEMLESCVRYGRIVIAAIPAYMLQCEFQSFFVVAEKPKFGLWVTVAAGVTNMVLDAVFVGLLKWGEQGAAAATALSQLVGAIIPLVYFCTSQKSTLKLKKAAFDGRALLKACTNGSSEMMTNISMSLVNMLYNFQLMRFAGENGVAAYGVIMYINFIFVSVFIGYSIGTSPVVGFHYGAKNHSELKSILRKSGVVVGILSLVMLTLSEFLSGVLSGIFVGYDENLMTITKYGFMIYATSFVAVGFNIFLSAFFTALNNGAVSAVISFLRTLLFQAGAVMLLPLIWGLNGIWLSIVVAEGMSLVVGITFLIKQNYRYNYL